MIEAVVFWGASGQAKVLRELLGDGGPRLVALFDNDLTAESPWPDVPLYRGREGFDLWRREQTDLSQIGCLVAIGGQRGADRLVLQRQLASAGLTPLVVRHPTAFVAGSARLGAGSQVLAHAVVAVDVVLGEACIVNTGATVDHECRIGDGTHICPGAHLAGLVTVGDRVMVGTGATILPRVKIGNDAIVGAGAVVIRDVPPGACVVGNPAKVRNRKES
ncbi:MAG TPA: NeuD/PglB/VioB family sugar acetyltransferase [Polyangia bacterium]|nr:NeuD/PglB/VioB family sugar acetyltransferase [Polyangia bacterium]